MDLEKKTICLKIHFYKMQLYEIISLLKWKQHKNILLLTFYLGFLTLGRLKHLLEYEQ